MREGERRTGRRRRVLGEGGREGSTHELIHHLIYTRTKNIKKMNKK